MNNLQLKIELESTITNYVSSLMAQNDIPASMMEDALNKVLLAIKDRVVIDLLLEQSKANEAEEGTPAE